MTRISPFSLRLLFTLALAAVVLAGTPSPPLMPRPSPWSSPSSDLQVILRDSKARRARAVAWTGRPGFQADLAKQGGREERGQQLEQARASMAADDFRKKRRGISAKGNAARQSGRGRRQQDAADHGTGLGMSGGRRRAGKNNGSQGKGKQQAQAEGDILVIRSWFQR